MYKLYTNIIHFYDYKSKYLLIINNLVSSNDSLSYSIIKLENQIKTLNKQYLKNKLNFMLKNQLVNSTKILKIK